MTDFQDLIDTDDLEYEEEERLRSTHELLLRAGPPPDLPPALLRPPAERREAAEVIDFPLLPRRRPGATLILAAAVAAAVFGGGYLFGHSKAKPSAFAAQHVVPMHATGKDGVTSAIGLVKVANTDSAGNSALEFQVTGLPKQPTGSYYELWLTRHGEPWVSCGTFRMQGRTTTVRFSVPYTLSHYSGWVVTGVTPTKGDAGETLMTT
jgi:hypothetical protein